MARAGAAQGAAVSPEAAAVPIKEELRLPQKPKVKPPPLTGPQKAAAVVVSLGADKASQIYQFMDPADVEQLTLEVAKLGFLNSDQTEEVLTDFYQMRLTNKAVTEGGME